MIIKFSEDLSEQHIYANGNELAGVMGFDRDEHGNRVYEYPDEKKVPVATISNPVLVTDIHKIAQFKPTVRDTIIKLFESPMRITEYDGVSIAFEQNEYVGVWGPSIDTLLFCKGLKKLDLSGVRRAVEIGAGSGFISKYVLEKYPNIQEIALVDINPSAKKCWQENIDDTRANFFIEDGVEFLKNHGEFELLLCNPPYVPRPASMCDNPYEGTKLLEHLISHFVSRTGDEKLFVTNFSSLSKQEVLEVVEKHSLGTKELASMTVPLKVMNILNNEEWVNFLLERGLSKDLREGYEHWQTIEIMVLGGK